ncbi:MAG: LLM class flavin-dependent oxidoreductase [Chloroflexi bacterium]|nr:LLM class flavin-dependent oxidoreductase [Chloroflexota bacterium]MBV9546251.1 LLM class flavin-dependent oxidoreductase [Chloroflexota bacterium]
MTRLRFGIFMAPFHAPVGQNPTAAYARDVATIQLLDELGYDEAWIGEHHSGGVELIPSPEIFIAHVAAQTRYIKLGAGVISLPYHNPLWVADRMILLDHLTRGRVMMGVGPGALPTDAAMIGIDPLDQRAMLEQDFDVLMHLLLKDEPISIETSRYKLVNARSQYRPYSDPIFPIGVAAIASPSGPRLAGKYGVGLLSVGATIREGFDALHLHWDVMEERAGQFGAVADRRQWRLVGPIHLSDSKKQAIEDVRYGLDAFCDYTQHTIAAPHFRAAGSTFDERVGWVNDTGLGVIGTPDEAIAQIERLQEQSGGFGCYLMMAHEWADPAATRKSYELFARYVMPRFQNSATRLFASERWSQETQSGLDARQAQALKEWTDKHAGERAARQPLTAS